MVNNLSLNDIISLAQRRHDVEITREIAIIVKQAIYTFSQEETLSENDINSIVDDVVTDVIEIF